MTQNVCHKMSYPWVKDNIRVCNRPTNRMPAISNDVAIGKRRGPFHLQLSGHAI
jgi:hypothetical protein